MGDAPELLDRFNKLDEILQQRVRPDAGLMERKDVQDLIKLLEHVRGRLTRPRYLVGFTGSTQSGKSSTILSLLAPISPGEEPVSRGAGLAKTSAITRIFRLPATPHTFLPRYLSEDNYVEKRSKLCEAVHEDSSATNEAIVRRLPDKLNRQKTVELADDGDSDEDPPLKYDIEALVRFLKSYDKYSRDYVFAAPRQPREDINIPFEKRTDYINHHPSPDPFEASPTALLQDVVIGFHSERIPVNLEMIDLPGLGSAGSVDCILSTSFLKELDGALVFVNCKREDTFVEKILNRLDEVYQGNLASRTWIVATMFDGLTKEHLFGDDAGNTVFDALMVFLKRHNIPPRQVCLTSNEIFRVCGPDGVVPRQRALDKVGLAADDPIPPKFKDNPDFHEAFEALLRDGGIGRLRDLFANTLEKQVAQEIRETTAARLSLICQRLTLAVQQQERLSSGGFDLVLLAQRCANVIDEVLAMLDENMSCFDAQAQLLRDGLQECFDTFFPDNPSNRRLDAVALKPKFPLHARALQQKLDALFTASVLPPAYDQGGKGLEQSAFAALPFGEGQGPAQAWEHFRLQDCGTSQSWRGEEFPTFRPDDQLTSLFAQESDEFNPLTGTGYRELMTEKIRVVTQQAIHALRNQLRQRLEALLGDLAHLTQLDDRHDWMAPANTDYAALLTDLRTICPSI